MLIRAIRWSNGEVVSRDETTSKIPELCGKWDELREKIRREAGNHTQLLRGDWENGVTVKVSQKRFFEGVL